MDAVVAVLNGKVKYFHNISKNANHWSLLKLIGKRSNRMGGAQIRITGEDGAKQYNQVTTAVGYACASDSRYTSVWAPRKRSRDRYQVPSRITSVAQRGADRILTIEEPPVTAARLPQFVSCNYHSMNARRFYFALPCSRSRVWPPPRILRSRFCSRRRFASGRRHEGAIRQYRAYLKLRPDSPDVRSNLGAASPAQGATAKPSSSIKRR